MAESMSIATYRSPDEQCCRYFFERVALLGIYLAESPERIAVYRQVPVGFAQLAVELLQGPVDIAVGYA